MRIFVTGASGFIGRYLVAALLAAGHEVWALLRRPLAAFDALPQQRLHRVYGSLAELSGVSVGAFDACYHLAWGGVSRAGVADAAVQEENVRLSLELLEFARSRSCGVFVDAGSRQEYAPCAGVITETSACSPLSAYGKGKLQWFEAAQERCARYGMQYVHFRIFSVYGIGDHPWSLVASTVAKLCCGADVELGPCTQQWSYLHIRDAAAALTAVLSRRDRLEPLEVLNLAGSDVHPLRWFVECIRSQIETRGALLFGSFRQQRESAFSLCPSVAKAAALLDWRERIPFAEGVAELIAHQRAVGIQVK